MYGRRACISGSRKLHEFFLMRGNSGAVFCLADVANARDFDGEKKRSARGAASFGVSCVMP
jgi:hypothetical protein